MGTHIDRLRDNRRAASQLGEGRFTFTHHWPMRRRNIDWNPKTDKDILLDQSKTM